MENSNNNIHPNIKLQIAFPKSNEDHRLQLVEMNGSIFAIVHSLLESLGPIQLNCEDWSLILLAPIKSRTSISISAINIICLSEIESEEGAVNIHASNRLVEFAPLVKSKEKVSVVGVNGKFQFEADPGAFLHYHRLFDSVIRNARDEAPDSFLEAQQKFITGLCTLSNTLEGKTDTLTLPKILNIWNIPGLKS